MYVCKDSAAPAHTSTHAYTRTQARGATPELRRVTADTTSHGSSSVRRQAFHTSLFMVQTNHQDSNHNKTRKSRV